MATLLVTGGCGFIGSHLAAALLRTGHRVRVLDDLSTGRRENLPPGAELALGSVCDPDAVAAALEGVDACFHLAAIASVEKGVQDWLGTHRVNLTGLVTLFDALARAGALLPVVYASSAAVYGATEAPVPGGALEEEMPAVPLSAYGADKLGCELHARVAGVVHGMPTAGLRFFNVFGPRQDPKSPYSGVISIFCDRLLRGDRVEVYGDGLQTRDFVHVDDVVAALVAALGRASTAAPVYNICTGIPTTVLQLAGVVAELCGVPATIRHGPPRAGEVRHSLGSPARARAELGLAEPVPLRRGLQATLAWMRTAGPG